MNHKDRIFGLDLLRAAAVIFVVYAHAYGFVAQHIPQKHYFLPALEGVSIFFGLSGFLIGRILLKTALTEQFDFAALKTFWVRRWWRTLPNYFLVLFLIILGYNAMGMAITDPLWRYVTFSQNIATRHPGFFPEAWSLAVEEWFYLCVPIPFLLAARLSAPKRKTFALALILLVITAVFAFRVYRAKTYGFMTLNDWDLDMRKQVLLRFDGLMFGVLAAYISLFHERQWAKYATASLVTGALVLIADKVLFVHGNVWHINNLTIAAQGIGTAMLLPALSSWRRRPDFVTRAVSFISSISYSLYLVNYTLVLVVLLEAYKRTFPTAPLVGLKMYIAYWLVTIALAYLLYRFFERPTTAMREQRPQQTGPTVTAFQPTCSQTSAQA